MEELILALSKLLEKRDGENFDSALKANISEACSALKINEDSIISLLPQITAENTNDNSHRWRFIALCLHVIISSDELLAESEVFSVAFASNLRKALQFIVSLGVLPNLMKGVGIGAESRLVHFQEMPTEEIGILEGHRRLCATTKGLLVCASSPNIRSILISSHFGDLLAALYQLSFAPLKKPEVARPPEAADNSFCMTEELHRKLLEEQSSFAERLKDLLNTTHPPLAMKELMVLLGNRQIPLWLRRNVNKSLDWLLLRHKGVESMIRAIVDSSNDTGVDWKQLDIVVKLVMLHCENEGNVENIAAQLVGLSSDLPQFHKVLVRCIKQLYEKNPDLCKKKLLSPVFAPWKQYYGGFDAAESTFITSQVERLIGLVQSCFVQTNGSTTLLPPSLLSPYIVLIFYLYLLTYKSQISDLSQPMAQILLKYFEKNGNQEKSDLFAAVFGTKHIEILGRIQEDLEFSVEANDIRVYRRKGVTIRKFHPAEVADCLLHLCQIGGKHISAILVAFLLDFLAELSFDGCKPKASPDLLGLESETVALEADIEMKLASFRMLCELCGEKTVWQTIRSDPWPIAAFVRRIMENSARSGLHQTTAFESANFETLFIAVMVLEAMLSSADEQIRQQILSDLGPLIERIVQETTNQELKSLLERCSKPQTTSNQSTPEDNPEKSDFEKAMDDLTDPLLPARGHGLLTLAKLLEKRDAEACSRKQYLLHIFQQNLKNDDSFIYLNAIGGLAALADTFPDQVVHTLAEEYSDLTKDSNQEDIEVRMKLGEVMVRVTKGLGEMAPKYKATLLGAFLNGTRDHDHLVRASSLSNLGEICRVLGYKLGSIISEILHCVHSIVTTDKAAEARRAAVMVLRQLLAGLGAETIAFLRDEILPIYRDLKWLYQNDKDDVARLHAQLALEELNANMNELLLPKLPSDSKVFVMK